VVAGLAETLAIGSAGLAAILDRSDVVVVADRASHQGVRQVWSRRSMSSPSPFGKVRERDSIATSSPVSGEA